MAIAGETKALYVGPNRAFLNEYWAGETREFLARATPCLGRFLSLDSVLSDLEKGTSPLVDGPKIKARLGIVKQDPAFITSVDKETIKQLLPVLFLRDSVNSALLGGLGRLSAATHRPVQDLVDVQGYRDRAFQIGVVSREDAVAYFATEHQLAQLEFDYLQRDGTMAMLLGSYNLFGDLARATPRAFQTLLGQHAEHAREFVNRVYAKSKC